MSPRRQRRLLIALCAVFSLVFSQLASAHYRCPSKDVEMVMEMPAGMPCEGMDEQQPALCFQSMHDVFSSADVAAKPAAVASPSVLHVLYRLEPVVHPERLDSDLPGTAERPPPDPRYLETLRLRV